MNRFKTLSLPLATVLAAAAISPADAQVRFGLSSQKTFRQNKTGIRFLGGTFNANFSDGHVASIGVCNDFVYDPPGFFRGVCSPGTSGFLSAGTLNGATIQRPYVLVTELQPAVAVQPFAPDKVILNAAPASGLSRPAGGFTDSSLSVYYNLHTTGISEYSIAAYGFNKPYTKGQLGKFDKEIVEGVYYYGFPRLNFPLQPAPVTAVIYPVIEGRRQINNRPEGFQFTKINENHWVNNNQFIELSYARPNRFEWEGLTTSSVFPAVDDLYFSLRALRQPGKPRNSDLIRGEAVFPSFTNTAGQDARVLLRNPLVSNFTTPPILPSGTKAMVEIELQRNFQTGAVTYDYSNRRFQIPVIILDRYTDYKMITLAGETKKKILEDADKDGFNNLTEWILESNGADAGSVPAQPFPAAFQAVDFTGRPTAFGSYYGFNVTVKQGTVPKVKYILQRSKDGGRTWSRFKFGYYDTNDNYSVDPPTDNLGNPLQYNWVVFPVTDTTRGIKVKQIQVRSGIINPNAAATIPTIAPPGTLNDVYRIKIVLKKKKKA